jgi:predicted phosphoribosyltransferase
LKNKTVVLVDDGLATEEDFSQLSDNEVLSYLSSHPVKDLV